MDEINSIMSGLSIGENGHLQLHQHDLVEISNKYETPLYVLDEEVIRNNCSRYVDLLKKYYKGDFSVIYASKAFLCLHMCKIINSEGLGMDVVSDGEIYTAYKSGFPMDKVIFHGNNKLYKELELAIDLNIGRIVIDNLDEIYTINKIAREKDKIINVMIRVKPGIEAHTHSSIKTGQEDSKFGISKQEIYEAINKINQTSNLNLCGLHCHIGSQIFDTNQFLSASKIMMSLIYDIKCKLGLTIQELNLGGGFGVRYTNSDISYNLEELIKSICDELENNSKTYDISLPKLYIEPGRSIVSNSGLTLYKVGAIKDIPGIRKYICIDGGMTDNPRYALYKSKYEIINASRSDKEKDELVTVAGKCCESGDLIAKDIYIQSTQKDDILAVLCTGAYNYSMSSNYNRIAKPAVLLINREKESIIVNRQTLDDVISNDIILDNM